MDLSKLKEPFIPNEIEWRIGQAGKNAKGIWCKVLAYVTNRAVMDRLDTVCGPENWRNEYVTGPQGGVLCGISIRIQLASGVDTITKAAVFHGSSEWVTKWDGAENTDIEAVKGGLSDSMKRAAVQWGIGRYLYDLDEGFAEVSQERKPGSRFANCKIKVDGKEEWVQFHWLPPSLPHWAQPNGKPKAEEKPPPAAKPKAPPSSAKDIAERVEKRTPDEIYADAKRAIANATMNRVASLRGGIQQYADKGQITSEHASMLHTLLETRIAELEAAAAASV